MPDGGRVGDLKKGQAPAALPGVADGTREFERNEVGRELESRQSRLAADPRVVSRLATGQQVRLIQQMQRGYGNAQVARMVAQIQAPPANRVAPPPALTTARPRSADDELDPESREAAEPQSVQRELAAPPLPPPASNGSPVVQRSLGGAILNKAAEWAHDVPGYTLLTVVLGKDPINDQPVPRTAVNFVHGVISLIPGGDAIFKNLQESGAIDQAFAWLNSETAKLGITWGAVKGAVSQVFDSLSWSDAFEPSAAWDRVKHIIMPLVEKVKSFALDAGKKLFEFIFEGALKLAGPLAGTIMNAIRKAGDVVNTIAKDPVAFLGNLLRAVKGGFEQFMANIATHLKQGLLGWLFGSLAGAGIELPKSFDLKGILSLVLQILGLSWQNLRAKLVGALGEPVVGRVEKAIGFVKTIATEGIGAAWQQIIQWITESIGNLKDLVLGAIKDWVVTTIIKQAVMKLVSMFNPVGAIVQAIITIYNTVQFVIEKAKQIADLASAVLDSIANIAAGNIAAAANYVEATLGKAVPVVIGFLADLIGLGGITDKIKEIIQKIRQPIDKVMNKLVAFVAAKAKPIIDTIKKTAQGVTGAIKQKTQAVSGAIKGKLGIGNEKKAAGPATGGVIPSNHEALATLAVAELEKVEGEPKDYQDLRRLKEAKAREIEVNSTKQLQPGIKLTVKFTDAAKDQDNGALDFEVVIAPNDTVKRGIASLSAISQADLAKAKANFGKRLFPAKGHGGQDLASLLNASDAVVEKRIKEWMSKQTLFALTPGEAGDKYMKETLYTFGRNMVNPSGWGGTSKRELYGYKNPTKESSRGLKILSKGITSQTRPADASLLEDADFHQKKARYNSARPGSAYKNFRYSEAILGHREDTGHGGASGHWNSEGHSKDKDYNRNWNQDPDNYWGPEHMEESAASGSQSERYRVPAEIYGSHTSWWEIGA